MVIRNRAVNKYLYFFYFNFNLKRSLLEGRRGDEGKQRKKKEKKKSNFF
jgi:hypothetical protein